MKTKQVYKKRETLMGWAFVLPFLILFTVFTIYPVVQGVWVSLNDWSLMGRLRFIGLGNYQKMLGDKNFWEALQHTCLFVVFCVPLVVILSLVLALLANRKTRFRRFLRTSFYLPGILSVSVASYVAQYTFAPYRGLINGILESLGAVTTKTEPLWLQDPKLVWATIVFMTGWWTLGFPMLLYLSALQDISPEIMEAAEVDGANARQRLFQITLPLLKRTIYLVIMLQVIASFKVFGQIRLITKGGPANKTRPLIMYIYQQAFDKNKLGYAAAMSYALFLILIVCTIVQLKLQKGDD